MLIGLCRVVFILCHPPEDLPVCDGVLDRHVLLSLQLVNARNTHILHRHSPCIILLSLTPTITHTPFRHRPFLHVVLICILFSNLEMKPLFFMSIFCTLLYFFPKIVLSLLGLLVLWMLWPLLMQLRVIIVKFIEAPYGEGTMPEKVKNSEEAVEIAQGSGKSHTRCSTRIGARRRMRSRRATARCRCYCIPTRTPTWRPRRL